MNRFSVKLQIGLAKMGHWCHRKQTDPFSNHLREVLGFLAENVSIRISI